MRSNKPPKRAESWQSVSKYAEFKTTFTDGPALAEALKAMGFDIECHETETTLYGYIGDARPQKAHIIIRRNHTGISASNDIGFRRGADGKYEAIISQFDEFAKFNSAWMGLLKQAYTEQRQMAVARQRGYVFQGREQYLAKDGRPQVRLMFAAR